MTFRDPCLVPARVEGATSSSPGDVVERYLAFVTARCRSNTVIATRSDLRSFFAVIGKDPIDVTPADVLAFIAQQRQPHNANVVRLDGERGLSARTIKRRVASVSGLFGYLVLTGERVSNPVPRGLSTRRRGRRGAPLVRTPHTLPRVLTPAEVKALLGALRRWRDRAMLEAMLLGGLRACEVIGLRLQNLRPVEKRGWPDAPARTPMFAIDVPVADDPLPRFLDDAESARLMAAAANAAPLERLVVELLARTGLRASELCDLDPGAVERIGGAWWLRVPLGKLRNERYVPLHPALVELLGAWEPGHTRLLERDGRPLDRHLVGRIVRRVATSAGLTGVHPHRLRHTLATQAINRGMRLEAIAALLGHRSLRMTMTYARIANRTVADEYAAAQARVDALYDNHDEPQDLRRLRLEHRRLLGNGYCARPRGTDCSFEAICEGCGYYQTGAEFAPTLRAQRDHAARHGQPVRVELYNRLLERVETTG